MFVIGLDCAGTYVLQTSVIALGLGLSLDQLVRTGWESLPVMIGTLLVAFAAMYVFGRLLGVQGELRTLIGAGTAICGGSAIAAASAIIGPTRANIAYAMSTIFLYNALAVLAFPVLGHILDLSQSSSGYGRPRPSMTRLRWSVRRTPTARRRGITRSWSSSPGRR